QMNNEQSGPKVTVNKTSSFIFFVLPFLFDSGQYDERIGALATTEWQAKKGTFSVWSKMSFPADDVLPHVANYLNPDDQTTPTANLWSLDNNALNSPRGLGAKAKWFLVTSAGEIAFTIKSVQLILFRLGVGFLTVDARPVENDLSVWLDLLHYFRFVGGQRRVRVKAHRQVGKDTYEPFFPEVAGGIQAHPEGTGNFGEVIEALLSTAKLSPDKQRWWRDVFIANQLIPYTGIFMEGLPESEIPHIIYKIRNFFNSRQQSFPSLEDLDLHHSQLLPYSERQWFISSLDGGSFVAFDALANEFFLSTLPDHLRKHYFLIFIMSLNQRFSLMSLSHQVSDHWLKGDELAKAESFDRIREDFLEFTARGYFPQIMQREHHHKYYMLLHHTFQIERHYQDLSFEVREMYDYLVKKNTEQLKFLAEEQRRHLVDQRKQMADDALADAIRAQIMERRISTLGFIIGVPALVISFLGINLAGVTSNQQEGISVSLALFVCLLGVIIGLLLLLIIQRKGQLRLAQEKLQQQQIGDPAGEEQPSD
ncbi:hypothetical protein ACFL27_22815, partial [candidate division CSSED10-310 bacterium]